MVRSSLHLIAALSSTLIHLQPLQAQTTPVSFADYLNGVSWPDGQVLRFSELAGCRETSGPARVPNSPGRAKQLEQELAAMQQHHKEANHLLYAAGASRYSHLLESWQEVSRSSGEVVQELQAKLNWEKQQNVSIEEVALNYGCDSGTVTVLSADGLQRCIVSKVRYHYRVGRHDASWDDCLWLEKHDPPPQALDTAGGSIKHDQRIWVYAP